MDNQNTSEHGYDFSGTISVLVWHQNLVLTILSILGILGIFLNGFVICCFILHPIVSKDLFGNTDLLICISLRREKELKFFSMLKTSFIADLAHSLRMATEGNLTKNEMKLFLEMK